MPAVPATRVVRSLAVTVVLSFVFSATVGCGAAETIRDYLPGGGEPGVEDATVTTDHGPCLPTYGDDVLSASMSRDGTRILFISEKKPAALADDAAWGKDDRAIYVLHIDGDTTTTNSIATSWAAPEDSTILVAATPDDTGWVPDPVTLEETMIDVQIAGAGDRFLVSAARQGSSGLVKLYTGMVPEGDAELSPGEGLSPVPINVTSANQYIQSYHLTEDGSRVAAVVGAGGEVRVYDFDTETLWAYEIDEDGETVVTHDLPPAQTSIADDHTPAVGSSGTMRLAWSPDGRRLSFSRPESVGTAGVWLLDTDTGETTFVRGYRNTTVPWVAWAADGNSLFVLSTAYDTAQTFGNSEMRRVAAEANGADIGDRWKLTQDMFYDTAPSFLVAYGDDENFLFLWEFQAWLMEVPATGTGPASYGPITLKAPSNLSWDDGTMAIKSGSPSASPARDTAAFVVSDRAGTHVGARLWVQEAECPLEPQVSAEGEDTAATDGEDTDAAEPAEGDGAEGDAAEGEEEQAPAEGEADEETPAEGEADEESEESDEGSDG